ncbi:High mobility group protein B1 [Sciurus carolinensis]|uniref:High mobility group protein B1 n=1 Tax=Sciurus carolinensis TaxID=30640 RepID=A0AA41SVH8_SCICA|nr:High mobility group protein B1 [Sciurus carolinensis]
MSAKQKGKCEELAKANMTCYEREMQTYVRPTGETQKKLKNPKGPRRPPSASFLYCSENHPKTKRGHPLEMLQRTWRDVE